MSSGRIPRTSTVLFAATLLVTSSAVDFEGQNDFTQSDFNQDAGTVAPGGETPTTNIRTGAEGFDNPVQWSPSSSNNEAPTTVTSSGSGGWSQPTTPVTADSPTVYSMGSGLAGGDGDQPTTAPASGWTPSDQSSDVQDQGWTQVPSSDTGNQQPSPSDNGNQGWGTTTTSQGSETGGIGDQGLTPTSSGTGDHGSSQQTDFTSSTTPSAEPPLTSESSGFDDGTLSADGNNSGENGGGPPGGSPPGGESTGGGGTPTDDWGSLECSGSDDEGTPVDSTTPADPTNPTDDWGSLECSGSDEEEPPASTSGGSSNTIPSTTEAPTSSSDTYDQNPTPPISSSDTDTPVASEGDDQSTPTMSVTSSGTGDQGGQGDQGSSQTTQTSTASSSNTESITASSSNTPIEEGSDSTQQSTSTGEHASFGTVTSKSGECVIGKPNEYVSPADIDWIWENRIGPGAPFSDTTWNIMVYKNWIMDHIVKNKATLNYCVRWDSTEKLSKTVASKFKDMLERQYAAWNHWLIGYNCWPYNKIKVNIVGFAVKEASLLDWSDDTFGPITVGDLDENGDPQCDQTCYRFYDNVGSWSDTSGCKGDPFDMSLWLKQGLVGGLGDDWGQKINLENMLESIDQDQLEILSHEIGHGFGLPDFYKPADKPNGNWPKSIMMAGSSGVVTDSDGWMLRRVLENFKPRYNFG